MTDKPLLSICIPTYNRADMLEYCLENLRELDQYDIDYEIVVLNHASTDHTAEMLEKAQEKWDNLRVYHQTKQVHLAGQWIAAIRLARGEIVTCMADDDKLIADKFVEYVRYMHQHPDVSVTYAPWLAYDDEAEKPLHGYFEVKQRMEYRAGQGFNLFTFLVQNGFYPEIALYRAEAFQPIMFSHSGAGFPHFIWMYEFLKQGKVVVQPEPYYLEVAKVKSRFANKSRLNLEFTLTYLDNTRAGLEVMLMRIIQDNGGNMISPDARNNMHEVTLKYLFERLQTAFTRAVGREDFLTASELAQRIMLWFGPSFHPEVTPIAQFSLFRAGAQAIGWVFDSMSWKEELVLYGFEKEDKVEEWLAAQYPDISVRRLDKEKILSSVDPEKAVLVVKLSRQRGEFTDHFLPGHVISLEDSTDYYKFFPMNYSLEAA